MLMGVKTTPLNMESASSMESILEKTRIISRSLQNRREPEVDFVRLASLLSEVSVANVYIASTIGEILGHAWTDEYNCPIMVDLLNKGHFPERYLDKLNHVVEPVVNSTDDGQCAYGAFPCQYPGKYAVYLPIMGGGNRLGTLILARFGMEFKSEDLVLGEYMSTVVGIEILHQKSRRVEEEGRERLTVQMALKALSYSEAVSIQHIIAEMKGMEGVVVASRVADKVGVTRSVIVNALRKLESAGIIESRSLGMKGTYIKFLSGMFVESIQSSRVGI